MEDYNTQVVARAKGEYYRLKRKTELHRANDMPITDEYASDMERLELLGYVLGKVETYGKI